LHSVLGGQRRFGFNIFWGVKGADLDHFPPTVSLALRHYIWGLSRLQATRGSVQAVCWVCETTIFCRAFHSVQFALFEGVKSLP
jgi:hypothetical protein